MFLTIEEFYQDGKIELVERPDHVKKAKVLVTFLAHEPSTPEQQRMLCGQFAGEGKSSEEDFLRAEWRSETETGNGD